MKPIEEVDQIIQQDPTANNYRKANDKQGFLDQAGKIYRENGYDSQGNPLTPPTSAPRMGNSSSSNTRPDGPPDIVDLATDPWGAVKRGGEKVAEIGRRNILPLTLQAGAAYATKGMSIPAQLMWNAITGGVSRQANTVAGIEPQAKPHELAIAVASSAVPTLGARVGQRWWEIGGNKGEILVNRNAPQQIKTETDLMRMAGATDADWAAAKAAPGHIAAPNLKKAMREVQTEVADAKSPEAQKMVAAAKEQAISFYQRLNGSTGLPKGGFGPGELQKELEQLGATVKRLDKEGGSNTGLLKKMMSAMSDDLEQSTVPAAQALWKARKAEHRNLTLDEFQKDLLVGVGMKFKRGEGGNTQFDGNAVLKKLMMSDHFEKVFTPIERQDLIALVSVANTIPGVNTGSKLASYGIRTVGGAAAASTLATGGDPLLAGAAYAGAELANAGVRLYKNNRAAMQTAVGRKFVDDLNKQNFWTTVAAAGGHAAVGSLTNFTGTKSYDKPSAETPVPAAPVITPDMLEPTPKALSREERKDDMSKADEAGEMEEFKGRQIVSGRRVSDVKDDALQLRHILKQDKLRDEY